MNEWANYTVPAIADVLAAQPDAELAHHLGAWQHAYETMMAQRRELLDARAALADAWPVPPDGAAGAFVAQIDALADSLEMTANAAIAAHQGLTGIGNVVDAAKSQVADLHRSWAVEASSRRLPYDDWAIPLNV